MERALPADRVSKVDELLFAADFNPVEDFTYSVFAVAASVSGIPMADNADRNRIIDRNTGNNFFIKLIFPLEYL